MALEGPGGLVVIGRRRRPVVGAQEAITGF